MSLTVNRPWTVFTTNPPSGNNGTTQNGTYPDIMTDYRTPLVKTPRGPWRMPTSYSRTIETGSVKTYYSRASDTFGYNGYPVSTIGKIVGSGARQASGYYYVAPPDLPSGVENDLIIKARNKLKNMHVNLAQAFAERDQTTRLVSTSLLRVANLVRDVYGIKKHFNARYFRYLKNKWHKDDFFNYWLEIQYGWKPALSDVYGAMEALHEREKEAGRGLVTVKAGWKDNDDQRSQLSDQWSNCVYDFTRVRKIEHKAYIRLDFVQSNAPPTGTLAQLGITNPLELAWELLPWSFVADWFVPVGDYLSSLDATKGWDFKGGSFSSKSTCNVRAINAVARYDQYKPRRSVYVSCDGSGRQMRFNRKAYSSAPLPSRPSLQKLNNASHMHVANGIALLMGLITGGGRVR